MGTDLDSGSPESGCSMKRQQQQSARKEGKERDVGVHLHTPVAHLSAGVFYKMRQKNGFEVGHFLPLKQ